MHRKFIESVKARQEKDFYEFADNSIEREQVLDSLCYWHERGELAKDDIEFLLADLRHHPRWLVTVVRHDFKIKDNLTPVLHKLLNANAVSPQKMVKILFDLNLQNVLVEQKLFDIKKFFALLIKLQSLIPSVNVFERLNEADSYRHETFSQSMVRQESDVKIIEMIKSNEIPAKIALDLLFHKSKDGMPIDYYLRYPIIYIDRIKVLLSTFTIALEQDKTLTQSIIDILHTAIDGKSLMYHLSKNDLENELAGTFTKMCEIDPANVEKILTLFENNSNILNKYICGNSGKDEYKQHKLYDNLLEQIRIYAERNVPLAKSFTDLLANIFFSKLDTNLAHIHVAISHLKKLVRPQLFAILCFTLEHNKRYLPTLFELVQGEYCLLTMAYAHQNNQIRDSLLPRMFPLLTSEYNQLRPNRNIALNSAQQTCLEKLIIETSKKLSRHLLATQDFNSILEYLTQIAKNDSYISALILKTIPLNLNDKTQLDLACVAVESLIANPQSVDDATIESLIKSYKTIPAANFALYQCKHLSLDSEYFRFAYEHDYDLAIFRKINVMKDKGPGSHFTKWLKQFSTASELVDNLKKRKALMTNDDYLATLLRSREHSHFKSNNAFYFAIGEHYSTAGTYQEVDLYFRKLDINEMDLTPDQHRFVALFYNHSLPKDYPDYRYALYLGQRHLRLHAEKFDENDRPKRRDADYDFMVGPMLALEESSKEIPYFERFMSDLRNYFIIRINDNDDCLRDLLVYFKTFIVMVKNREPEEDIQDTQKKISKKLSTSNHGIFSPLTRLKVQFQEAANPYRQQIKNEANDDADVIISRPKQ